MQKPSVARRSSDSVAFATSFRWPRRVQSAPRNPRKVCKVCKVSFAPTRKPLKNPPPQKPTASHIPFAPNAFEPTFSGNCNNPCAPSDPSPNGTIRFADIPRAASSQNLRSPPPPAAAGLQLGPWIGFPTPRPRMLSAPTISHRPQPELSALFPSAISRPTCASAGWLGRRSRSW